VPSRNKTELAKQTKRQDRAANRHTHSENSISTTDQFWADLRLSPVEIEHKVLTSPLWLSLIALGPLILLILFSFIDALLRSAEGRTIRIAEYTFRDLGDPVFIYMSLSLFFAGMIYHFRWYRGVPRAFQSLLENKVLHDQKGELVSDTVFADFLEAYRRNLHSRKRYLFPLIFTFLAFGLLLFITIERNYWSQGRLYPFPSLYYLHIISRWAAGPIAWAFVTGIGFWTVVATTKAIMDLTPRFQINMQPLRSDKAGGLKPLGDLCGHLGLIILVVIIPLTALAVAGTNQRAEVSLCEIEMELFVKYDADTIMTEDRLAECMYLAEGGAFSDESILSKRLEIQAQLSSGSLKEVTSNYLEGNSELFQKDNLLRRYRIFYYLYLAVSVALVVAFFIVVKPLWNIHDSMVKYRQKLEREINSRISALHIDLTELIRQGKLDEANSLEPKIKLLRGQLDEIQKYPSWPISLIPTLRSYLTPSLFSTAITIIVTALKISPSDEAVGFFSELFKSLLGIK